MNYKYHSCPSLPQFTSYSAPLHIFLLLFSKLSPAPSFTLSPFIHIQYLLSVLFTFKHVSHFFIIIIFLSSYSII